MVSRQAEEEFEKDTVELTVPPSEPRPILIIVMGPAACGKSTIGEGIAESLQMPFIDGDTLHPHSNVQKMAAGHPLNDDDRLPWLALVRSTAERVCKEKWDNGEVISKANGGLGRAGVVIACSALKRWYRDILRGEVDALPPPVDDLPPNNSEASPTRQVHKPATSNLLTLFLYCRGTRAELERRIAGRQGHFFVGNKMLDSQLAVLDDPVESGEPGVAYVDIEGTKEDVADRAAKAIKALVTREVEQLDDAH